MSFPTTITSPGQILEAQPLISSAQYITNTQILLAIGQEEAKVWSKLAQRYTVPMSPVPPVVASIGIDLVCYSLLTKQALLSNTLEDSPWPEAYRRTEELLDALACGSGLIVTASGTVLAASTSTQLVYVSGSGYLPTFSELPIADSYPDPNKLDNEYARRDEW